MARAAKNLQVTPAATATVAAVAPVVTQPEAPAVAASQTTTDIQMQNEPTPETLAAAAEQAQGETQPQGEAVNTDALLATIVAKSAESETSCIYVSPAAVALLVDAGFAIVNAAMTDADGNIAARSTPAGDAKHAENVKAAAAATPAAAPAAPKEKPVISEIVAYELPEELEARQYNGRRPEIYPFSKLEVGQSFFVVATATNPDPYSSLNSTVSSANIRYSVEDQSLPKKKNKKGVEVFQRRQLRMFVNRKISDGAPWGFPGQKGAVVVRVKVPEVPAAAATPAAAPATQAAPASETVTA